MFKIFNHKGNTSGISLLYDMDARVYEDDGMTYHTVFRGGSRRRFCIDCWDEVWLVSAESSELASWVLRPRKEFAFQCRV